MQKYPFAREVANVVADASKPVDFNRGPSELAEAIRQKRPCRLSGRMSLHVVEIVETFQYPERFGGKRTIASRFEPIEPLSWTA